MANTGGSSPVPVQIITSANGQQVLEQVQSISPSMLQQQSQHHLTQQEVQGQIVYTTVASDQDSPIAQTVLVQQQQQQQLTNQQSQQQQQQVQQNQQQQQVIVHHHHQSHHPKPKTHFCQHCNKGFANKHGLQLHNKRHPNGECTVRSHICGECNRAFFQKNHLLLHQRQHLEQQRTVVGHAIQQNAQIDDDRTNAQEQDEQNQLGEDETVVLENEEVNFKLLLISCECCINQIYFVIVEIIRKRSSREAY